MSTCPCGSGLELDACCGPYVAGDKPAPTAEALMRSRYSAYTLGNAAYLQSTLCEAEQGDDELTQEEINAATWLGLDIRDTVAGGEGDDAGVVEFVARYKSNGDTMAHHERSTFIRENDRWVYEGGEINPKTKPVRTEKIGRNDPCTCGSGKKFKKCCGK